MAKSVLVVGLGRFGMAVARKMKELGHEVCGVDRDENIVNRAQGDLDLALVADVSDQAVVHEIIGAANYDLAIVAIGSDIDSSLLASLYLKEAGVPRIVAKATTPSQGKLLEAIRVDRVVYPEREAGEQLALELGRRHVHRSILVDAELEVEVIEPLADWVGHTLAELRLRNRYDVTVLAVKRGGKMIAPAGPDTFIQRDDTLMVIGKPKDLERMLDR